VEELEIGHLAGHELGVGEPGARVVLGVGRDAAGRRHRLAQRLGTEVGGGGGALALPEVDGDPERLVAVMLDGLELAETHGDGQPEVRARGSGRRGRALSARFAECGIDKRLELGRLAVIVDHRAAACHRGTGMSAKKRAGL